MGVDLYPGIEVEEAGAGLEDEGEGEVVGGQALAPHVGVEVDGVGHMVGGDEASDHGVPEVEVGVVGAAEEEEGVGGLAGVERGAEEDVE